MGVGTVPEKNANRFVALPTSLSSLMPFYLHTDVAFDNLFIQISFNLHSFLNTSLELKAWYLIVLKHGDGVCVQLYGCPTLAQLRSGLLFLYPAVHFGELFKALPSSFSLLTPCGGRIPNGILRSPSGEIGKLICSAILCRI